MFICLGRGADLCMVQLMQLPLTVSCSSKIHHIGFTFLVLAHPGSPGQRAVKQVSLLFLKLKVGIFTLTAGINSYVLLLCLVLIAVNNVHTITLITVLFITRVVVVFVNKPYCSQAWCR